MFLGMESLLYWFSSNPSIEPQKSHTCGDGGYWTAKHSFHRHMRPGIHRANRFIPQENNSCNE